MNEQAAGTAPAGSPIPTLACPRCRYDLTDLSPDDGTITCPECGRTCTPAEACGAARHLATRAAAFTREAIIGGSVGLALGGISGVGAWSASVRSPAIWALIGGVWCLSLMLGACGWFVAVHGSRETGSKSWPLAAASLVLGWIAAVHAVVGVLAVIVIAAGG